MRETTAEPTTAAIPDLLRARLCERIERNELELPLLPEVTWEVMQACSSLDADADRVTRILHRDQSLAGNVLRFANSPISGSQIKIVSLQQAVSRLGMRQIAELALTASVKTSLFDTSRRREILTALWRHSIAAALLAKEVARVCRLNVETAFLAGLLHDMGKPVLLHAILDIESKTGQTFTDGAVLQALDQHHAAVGARLGTDWKLAEQVTEAILHHHDWRGATDAGAREVAATLQLADLLAHRMLPGRVVVTDDCLRRSDTVEPLNLYPDELDGLCGKFERVRAVMEAMS